MLFQILLMSKTTFFALRLGVGVFLYKNHNSDKRVTSTVEFVCVFRSSIEIAENCFKKTSASCVNIVRAPDTSI